jgi:outer membrane protein
LGIGVISAPRPYVGAGNETRAIPLIEFEYKRFYFRGIVAGFKVVDAERFSLDVIGRAQFAGYEEEDSDFLTGMEDRRETAELGLSAAWRIGRFEIEGTAAADALGRSDGAQVSVALTWNRIIGRGTAGIFPSIGLVWQDADFVDYYAGVRPEEALPSRPRFEGSSAINFGAGIRTFYRLTDRASWIVLVRAERLADQFSDSPIIDDRWGYFGLTGVTYRF